MCRNSVDISSTLLPGAVSNADLIISKRAFRRCTSSVRLKYTDYIVKNWSDRLSVYLTDACFYPETTVLLTKKLYKLYIYILQGYLCKFEIL